MGNGLVGVNHHVKIALAQTWLEALELQYQQDLVQIHRHQMVDQYVLVLAVEL